MADILNKHEKKSDENKIPVEEKVSEKIVSETQEQVNGADKINDNEVGDRLVYKILRPRKKITYYNLVFRRVVLFNQRTLLRFWHELRLSSTMYLLKPLELFFHTQGRRNK